LTLIGAHLNQLNMLLLVFDIFGYVHQHFLLVDSKNKIIEAQRPILCLPSAVLSKAHPKFLLLCNINLFYYGTF